MSIGRHTYTHTFIHLSFQFPYPAEYDDWVWTDLEAEDEVWLYVPPLLLLFFFHQQNESKKTGDLAVGL